jgi:L-amino acid N-acyltransferase YncA
LADIPIIDYRAYNDALGAGDIHVRYHSFSMRERLEKANGRSDNQVMVVEDNRYGLYDNASRCCSG